MIGTKKFCPCAMVTAGVGLLFACCRLSLQISTMLLAVAFCYWLLIPVYWSSGMQKAATWMLYSHSCAKAQGGNSRYYRL